MRFLPIVTQIFLWGAIFESIRADDGSGAEPGIVGYTYGNMVAYYLLTMVTRAFSSMPGLASGIASQIRSGEMKKFLIQPIDMIGFLLLARVAHKIAYYTVATFPFVLVFYLCRSFFPGWPEPQILAAYIVSLLMAFLIGFFLEAAIGMIGFWFLEVSSLLFVYMLLSFFLSGHMFPIDMLDQLGGPWGNMVRFAPFQYLAYFPAAVFLGKVSGSDLIWGLAMQLGWLLFFIALCRVMFRKGVQRYSGFGG